MLGTYRFVWNKCVADGLPDDPKTTDSHAGVSKVELKQKLRKQYGRRDAYKCQADGLKFNYPSSSCCLLRSFAMSCQSCRAQACKSIDCNCWALSCGMPFDLFQRAVDSYVDAIASNRAKKKSAKTRGDTSNPFQIKFKSRLARQQTLKLPRQLWTQSRGMYFVELELDG
jgi:hypothetical protein